MITFIDVCRHFGQGTLPKIILEKASLRIEKLDRVGILAASGTGKSTIARLIAGLENPNAGSVIRQACVSWPIGFSSALHPHLTAAENVRLVAAMYNLDPDDLLIRVQTFAELGPAFLRQVGDLAPGQRGQLALALSMSVDFDMYLADELSSVGSKEFQNKCEAAINERISNSGLILLTRHIRTIERYCTRFVVLKGARFIECEDAAQAQEILNIEPQEEEQNAPI